MFTDKNYLLKELARISSKDQLIEFAKEVRKDPLTECEIQTKGDVEDILKSLKRAPKAVLEDAFESMFTEEELDEEDEDTDEDEFEDEEYEDEE